ncbi:MAG: hypothetical protein JSS10_05210 [Verrucomicrobia bacterium]|nr:hypothetical protein [Verrucomicrobiota bacterium]
MVLGEKFPPIAPIHFFRVEADLKYGKEITRRLFGKGYQLPDTSSFLGEEHFADVALAWHEGGIELQMEVHKKFEEAVYPKYDEGDAIELFIDTRDLKEAGFPTRFCHHFLILPQEVQGVRALELTRFRSEDSHPLCDPKEIEVEAEMSSREYTVRIHLPAEILHGYDPQGFDKLGLTYCIHRPKGESQHFAVSSKYVQISQHPSLWATCKLTK